MSLLVVSYPELEKADFDRIQSIRAEYDELGYKLIKPHFTLVFQVDGIRRSDFVDHVRDVSANMRPIHFVLRSAELLSDADTGYSYAVLIPDEGYHEIVKLHDMLYTDMLADRLRHDIPYVPHITVGNSRDCEVCQALCDRLNQGGFSVSGEISTLEVISYDGARIRSIERISLQDR